MQIKQSVTSFTVYKELSGYENVVSDVHWTLTLSTTANGKAYTLPKFAVTSLSNVNFSNFTPFISITEEQALQWVNTETNGSIMDSMTSTMMSDLAIIIDRSNKIAIDVPWAT